MEVLYIDNCDTRMSPWVEVETAKTEKRGYNGLSLKMLACPITSSSPGL